METFAQTLCLQWLQAIRNKMKLINATLIFLSLLLLCPKNAAADGPGSGGRRIRIDGEAVDGYLIRVVTSPTPALVNNLYLEVRLTDAVSGEIITDAIVWITAISGDDSVDVQAKHDNAPNPDEYGAHIPIPYAEVWKIKITIDQGKADISFLERVSNPNSVGTIIAVGAPIAGLLILGILFYWLRPKLAEEFTEAPPSPD